jgi:hypothetical protein
MYLSQLADNPNDPKLRAAMKEELTEEVLSAVRGVAVAVSPAFRDIAAAFDDLVAGLDAASALPADAAADARVEVFLKLQKVLMSMEPVLMKIDALGEKAPL